MRKILLNLIISSYFILGCIINTNAQQEQMYSHYDYNTLAINPAYAGAKQTFVANSLARLQWLNLPGAPRYYNLGVHSPLVKDFGVGLNLQTGSLGKFKNASPLSETQIAGSIAYNKQLTENLRLAVGLRLGVYNYNINLSQMQLYDQSDAAYNNNDINITAPLTGFGVYLYSDKFFTGISAPRMLFIPTELKNDINIQMIAVTQFYGFAGYVFDASQDLKIKTTTQIKVAQGVPVQVDLNAHAIYLEDYSVGLFYRTGGEAGLMATVNLNPNFTVVYSYDHRLAPLNTYVNGSHEFGLQYKIPYVSNSRVRVPRYF